MSNIWLLNLNAKVRQAGVFEYQYEKLSASVVLLWSCVSSANIYHPAIVSLQSGIINWHW